MEREATIKRLKEAKSLPEMTLADTNFRPKNMSEKEFADYLTDFAKPNQQCWLCENPLQVDWGLVHGHANCVSCGMGVTMYHYFKKEDGTQERWEYGIQTHPKHFSVNEEEED